MWKCVPRNLREGNLRVTRKISRSEKPSGQDFKQVSTVQTRLISPATQQFVGLSSPENNGKHFSELGECTRKSQNITKVGNIFRQESNEACRIVSTIIPSLTQQFNNIYCKGLNICQEKKNKKCGGRKQQKENQQESSWENGAHIGHTWLGALGWSTALVLGWYMIQPLCRFWVFPCENNERKHNWVLLNGSCKNQRHDVHYISLVEAISRTAFAQPLYIVSKDQAEKLSVTDKSDGLGGANELNSPPDITQSEQSIEFVAPFGPPTAEEALHKAAEDFVKVHNAAISDIDNAMGASLMQQGRHKEAITFFTQGMQYGNPVATYNLAVCYEKGLGTGQDYKTAAKYYKVASELGHATAMYNLGVFHVHGWGGLPVDIKQAHFLFEKASALGQSDAKRALDMVPMKKQIESMVQSESSNAFLLDLGLVQNTPANRDNISEDLQVENFYISVSQEETADFVTLSNGSQLDLKDLSQLIEDTILKYKVYQ